MSPHVLLARLDSAGDVLLTGPAVRAVRDSARRVTYLCGPRGRDAASLLPGIDDIVVASAPWLQADAPPLQPQRVRELINRIAASAVDEAILFTSFHQSPLPLALLLRLAHVPRIAAFSEDFAGGLLDVRVRRSDGHEVERALALAAAFGHRLPAHDDGRLHVRLDAGSGTDVHGAVIVHPGAAAAARTLAPVQWRAAVAALVEAGFPVAVTGSVDERALTAFVAAPGALDVGGRTSLAELAQHFAHARAVVTGNTGPAHLAAAVGVPVVVAFAPTVPAAAWQPWGVPHALLGRQDVVCAGCRALVCPLPTQQCLANVTPADVVGAVERLLSNRDARFPPLVAPPASPSRVPEVRS